MSKKNESSIEFITQKLRQKIKYMNYIIQGVEIFGVKKFNSELHELGVFKIEKEFSDKTNDAFNNKSVDFILDLVINEFSNSISIKRQDFFMIQTGRSRHIKAKAMAIVLIKKHTSLSIIKLGEFFNTTRQTVYNSIQVYDRMLKSKKDNRSFFEMYDRINKQILNKNKLKK